MEDDHLISALNRIRDPKVAIEGKTAGGLDNGAVKHRRDATRRMRAERR